MIRQNKKGTCIAWAAGNDRKPTYLYSYSTSEVTVPVHIESWTQTQVLWQIRNYSLQFFYDALIIWEIKRSSELSGKVFENMDL
jgi:hypothetical protein